MISKENENVNPIPSEEVKESDGIKYQRVVAAWSKEHETRKHFMWGFYAAFCRGVTEEKAKDWFFGDCTKVIGAPGTHEDGKMLENLDPENLLEKEDLRMNELWKEYKKKKEMKDSTDYKVVISIPEF